jgi:DNA-binding SARP family transcriptional activator/tetratricopeptide (TPR) repeat protein
VVIDVLTIRLLGNPDARFDGDRLEGFDAPRIRSLLAYLLLHRGTPQSRAHVAFLLWPESTESQAKTNLRQLLHHLRRVLPDPDRFLFVNQQVIGWREDAPYTCDVENFEEACERADGIADPREERVALTVAVENCGGPLLPECYEEWILPERERLRQAHLEALERLTVLLEEERDYEAAIRHAEDLLRHDSLREATYRRLMRLHALAGERARALRVYHTCATVLDRELAVEPGRETREAYRALLQAPEVSDAAEEHEPPGIPLVGRRAEWSVVRETLHEVAAGGARALLIRGEAGIGKTRLVEELETWWRRQGRRSARSRAYPAEGRLAYAPVVEWLRGGAVRPSLEQLDDAWLVEVARLLPEVRSRHPGLPAAASTTTAEDRQRLFHALARAVCSADPPLLLVLDDAHWCDQESLEFLHFLLRSGREAPLAVVVTVRPEEIGVDHPIEPLLTGLQRLQVLTAVELGPLDATEVGELSFHHRGRRLAQEENAALHRETGGNPLFVVETVREELARAGIAPAASRGRPSGVQAIIERRLQLLSPAARETASLAGIIGREFTHEVLREAGGRQEAELVDVLDELWRRRVVREQGVTAYDFVHDRVREVAAGLLGPANVRDAHARVAAALERLHGDDLDPVSAQLARHLEAAGETERALAAYRRAAAHAQGMSAIAETAAMLRRALALADRLPAGRDRDEVELELLTALGVPMVALEGYAGAGVLDIYRRARGLCERLGRPVDPPILRGLAIGAVVRAQLDEAEGYGRSLLAASEERDDGLLHVEGSYVLGVTAFWRGEFHAARQHLERGAASYDTSAARRHLRSYGQDPEVVCLSRLSYTLWFLGELERACRLRDEALALADRLDDPTSTVYALVFAARLAEDLGDTGSLRRFALAAATLADRHQLGFFTPLARILTGWLDTLDGSPIAGTTAIREGLAMYEDSGQPLNVPYGLAVLAKTQLAAGDPAAGLIAVDDALELTERTGLCYLDAELRRLRGQCLAARGDPEQALLVLDRALDIAQAQASPTLALRAAVSRAEILVASGRGGDGEALATLASLRARFEDRPEAADLRLADELLARAGAT